MSFYDDEEPPLTMEPREEPPPPPRRSGRALLLGGIAVACVLGAVIGVMARPQLIGMGTKPPPAIAAPERQMDIVTDRMDPEPPPPAPVPSERLETLPPDMAAAAPRPPPAAEPEWPRDTSIPPLSPRAPDAPEAPWAPEAPVARDPAWRGPTARAERPSFDCSRTRSQAEDMVCSDPALAASDRQMARAFQRALRAGVPPGQLRAEQNDWLDIRDDAARRSPRALAAVYDQRIEELNAMADGQAPGW